MGTHAVVIGAGIAGLAAARALRERFDLVTVVERDAAPAAWTPRPGAPQGAHAHLLMAAGLLALERLFPGARAELSRAGAVTFDTGLGLAWHQFGAWKRGGDFDLPGSFQTRPLLEHVLRGRVAQLATCLPGRVVTGLVLDASGRRVTGIRLRAAEGGADETLAADFVVDASGRGSAAVDWLAAAGFAAPPRREVAVRVGYATRLYEGVALAPGRQALAVHPRVPADRRMGVLLPIEGGRFVCSLGGWHKDFPPPTDAGYLEFARSLAVPDLFQAIDAARPVTPAAIYRYPSSLWRRFDRTRLPRGFVVLGDAMCSFNPLFGQGMSVALREAEALGELLRRRGAPEARYFARARRIVGTAWLLAFSEDARFPESAVRRGLPLKAVHAYTARVMALTASDPEVTRSFYRVMHLLDSPASLVTPRLMAKVLLPRGNRAG